MRFRHKLSFVLIALVVLPLVATGLLVQELVARNQTSTVDGRVGSTVSGASVAYQARLDAAHQAALTIADQPDVQAAIANGTVGQLDLPSIANGRDVVITSGAVRLGIPPAAPYWATSVDVGSPTPGAPSPSTCR